MSIENEFIEACNSHKGKISRRLGWIDCDLTKKPLFSLCISMGTVIKKPAIRVETGISHVEMYNTKSISSKTTPNRIAILNDEGHIVHVRPDTGIITFNGNVKGSIVEHRSFEKE